MKITKEQTRVVTACQQGKSITIRELAVGGTVALTVGHFVVELTPQEFELLRECMAQFAEKG
jgi:hypothetical protein